MKIYTIKVDEKSEPKIEIVWEYEARIISETEKIYTYNNNGTKSRLDKTDVNTFKLSVLGNTARLAFYLHYYTLDEISDEELVQKVKEYLRKKFEEMLK